MTRIAMTRTIYAPDQPPSLLARWASRLGLFFASMLPITFVLHRLLGLPTPVALNITAACFAGAALVLVMAIVSGLDIWVTGRQGAARIVFATTVAVAVLSVPVGLYLASRKWPVLNDITTDVVSPPPLIGAEKLRKPGSNSVAYPALRFAAVQQSSFPDIKTLVIPRSSEETFELVLQAIGKLKMRSAYEAPPDEEPGAPGVVEIADKTMVFGFTDDVVIRITGDETTSRVDVRSASRYGTSDFGRNAERVRAILKEISGRVEASVPNAEAALRTKRKKEAALPTKQARDGSPGSAVRRLKPDPSRSSVRRAPARKASPQE
jgi:Protein of unknown function (DUF1499)